jgi:hypothetical protein
MPAVTYGNTKGGFISACADIANRWRIPFAGPTITGIRINNIGTSSCRIAKIGLYSNILDADSDTSNLLTHGILSGSSFYINGSVSGIAQNTWAGYGYATSNVGEIMNANNGSLSILFANGTVITNGGFIRIGVLSSPGTITNVRFNISVTYDNGNTWEPYDACFASNGSSLNTETSQFINSNSTQIAKSNVYTLWKRKWRTAPTIDDVNLPYYTFPYNITRDAIGLENITSKEALKDKIIALEKMSNKRLHEVFDMIIADTIESILYSILLTLPNPTNPADASKKPRLPFPLGTSPV